MRKWLEFKNTSGKELLLLDVELGDYKITVPCNEGFQGLPVYMDDEVFCSTAHPAGVAQGSPGRVRLRHFPGRYLSPGEKLVSKQAVYGMAEAPGQARQAFWKYVVRRSHRQVLAELTGKKSWLQHDGLGAAWGRPEPWGMVDPPSEEVCMQVFNRLERLKKDLGLQFDYFWLDAGWWEYPQRFGLTEFNHDGFPNGPGKTIQRASELGMRCGLWFSRGSDECRIPEDVFKVWENAITHHVQKNNLKGFKFDGMWPRCFSKDHAERHLHLPGKYSFEPGADANIRVYDYARKLCPDGWLFGYWGHDSPWWLSYLDTAGYHGLTWEIACASMYPTLYLRDSVRLAWDQGQQYRNDMPPLGRYAEGIWTGTGWATLGTSRWIQDAMVDLCRGPAFLHLWTDVRRWTPVEADRFARLARILKAYPDCFLNSRLIIGDPWKGEPYGYACSDGERAFLVVNNPAFTDRRVEIKLDQSIGLAQRGEMDIYRHVPKPARMKTKKRSWHLGDTLSWYLRPNEVVFLEIAPVSKGPALGGTLGGTAWEGAQLSEDPYTPAAIEIALMFERKSDKIHVRGEIPPFPTGALLVLTSTATKDEKHFPISGVQFSAKGKVGDESIGVGSLGFGELSDINNNYGAGCWAVWKIPVPSDGASRKIDLIISESVPADLKVEHKAYILPWTPPDIF